MCDYDIPLLYAHNLGQQYLPVSHGQNRIFIKLRVHVEFSSRIQIILAPYTYTNVLLVLLKAICIHYKNIDHIIS